MRFGSVTNETCRAALESAYVVGTNGVYFVGPFVERVSFASQQLRALNLVCALVESGEVGATDSVAVIGAGLSGVSAAAGLLAKGAKVTLFEREHRELYLQKDTQNRYVHPSVNRWPVGSLSFTTELPFLDWYEALCADVIDQVYQQWMYHFEHLLVDKHLNCEVNGFAERDNGCYLSTENRSTDYGPFKCVIFATGFGEEVILSKSLLGSYWADNNEFDAALPSLKGKLVLSGLGDGALIEGLRILFPQFGHGKFTVDKARFLESRDFKPMLSDIEKRATRLIHDPERFSTFIHNEYHDLVQKLPMGFRNEIKDTIRKNIQVELVGPEAFPYIRNAAPIHQLLTAFAIDNGALSHTRGWLRSDEGNLWIELYDGSKRDLDPSSHVCRLGPNRDLTKLLSSEQIGKLKEAQHRLSDYLFELPKNAFEGHKITTCPPWVPNSKAFIASRKAAAADFMEKRFQISLSVDQEDDTLCFGAAVPVERHLNPVYLPDQLFGIDVRKKPIFEGEEYATSVNEAAEAGSLGIDPNRSKKIDALDVNAAIRRQGGSGVGRIGAFAVNQSSGELFAATASHSIAGATSRKDKAIVDSSGNKIGFITSRLESEERKGVDKSDAALPISSAIAWFKVSKETYVRPTSFGARESTFSTPLALLGSDVFSANRSFARGTIISVDATVRLKSFNTEQRTMYKGAMIVKSLGNHRFASKGDSGALVNSTDGSPIGIVIGGHDDNIIVAPLGEALLQSELSIPSVDFVRRWNQRATANWAPNELFAGAQFSSSKALKLGIKRALDLAIVASFLTFMLPILILIGIAIRLHDRGPSIYKSLRIGKDGQSFLIYKFRTMQMDANERLSRLLDSDPEARAEWNSFQKLQNDPRITPIGRFLRATSLDELPQLLNVIKGEMSLVGPRPLAPYEVARYGEKFAKYSSVKPGMTGLWQVRSRSSTTYSDRVEMDTYYVENWTLIKDLMIILRTLPAVLFGGGATRRSKL